MTRLKESVRTPGSPWRWSILPVAAATLVGLGLLVGGPGASVRSAGAQEGSPPNVVVVMTDDQDERSMKVMPTVRRRLAGQGTTFRNFFATFPLCCPSRATFLTGQYAHNHGVRSNQPPDGGYAAFDDGGSLPIALRSAGYRTAFVGKYLNGYGGAHTTQEVPRGWSKWFGLLDGRMFHYSVNVNGSIRQYGGRARDYQTDVLADEARSFVDAASGRSRPFFLTLSTLAPHHEGGPREDRHPTPRPAPRHEGRFGGERLPTPPSFNERDVSDKPSFVRDERRLDAAALFDLKQRHRARLASLLAVDDAVEGVVDKLRATGELGQTLIVFTSDNGYLLGEHRLTRKNRLYEESVGVPMVMRGPAIPEGVVRRQVTGNIDLAPTILDVANAEPGRVMDGIPLVPLAQDPTSGSDRDMLLETKDSVAVRTPDFMYAEHPGGEKELYDLARDPFQLESRHRRGAYNDEQRALAERLSTLKDCAGAECR